MRPRLDLREPAHAAPSFAGPGSTRLALARTGATAIAIALLTSPAALADGGVLMPDLMNGVPEADWDAVLGDTFLEA